MLPILFLFCVIASNTITSLNSEAGTTRLPNLTSVFNEFFVDPTQNTGSPSSAIYLSETRYQGGNVLIADRTFSLAVNHFYLVPVNCKNGEHASILVLQNSTNVACALLTESHLTSSNCVLISNTLKSTSGQIPSITCIDSDTDQPVLLDTSVVSLTLESVNVATANNSPDQRGQPSNSLLFGVVNSTFVNCINEEDSQSNANPDDLNVTGTFNGCCALFTNCKFFIDSVVNNAFTMVNVTDLYGNLTFLNTEFSVTGNTSAQPALYFTSVLGAPNRINIFSCKFKYSSESSNAYQNAIIRMYYAGITTITDSLFSSPDPAKPSQINGLYILDSHAPILIASTEFSYLRFSTDGGAFYMNFGVTHFTDCLFEANRGNAQGGAFRSQYTTNTFHRCTFRNNVAVQRGGAMRLNIAKMMYFEDCHFEGNTALENVAYRGNDIHFSGVDPKVFYDQMMIGCTSDSTTSKIGYYYTAATCGNIKTENTLLPSRDEGKPALDFVLYVAIPAPESDNEPSENGQTSNTECSKQQPCETIQPALTFLTKAESPAKDGKSMIDMGIGTFSAEATEISSSLEIVGRGWLVNSTAFTIVQTSGFEVVKTGNATFRSLSLKPNQDYTQPLVTMSSTVHLRLSNTRIECLADYPSPVLVLSKGQTQLYDSHFASISLTATAAIQISGSASLETFIVTFHYISRASGNGGSCIDSTTTGHINMSVTDAKHCRSTGRAGCYDFEDFTETAKVDLVDSLFLFNLANIKSDGTVATEGMKFRHDYATTGLPTTNIAVNSNTVRTRSSLNYHVLTNSTQSNLFYANVHYCGYATPMPFGERNPYGVHLADFTGFQVILDQMRTGKILTTLRFQLMPNTAIPFDPIHVDWQYLQIYQPTVYPIDYSKPLAVVTSNGHLYLSTVYIQMPEEFSVPPLQVIGTNTYLTASTLHFLVGDITVSHVPFVTCVDGKLVQNYIRFQPEAFTFVDCSMYELQGGSMSFHQNIVTNVHSTVNGAMINSVGTTLSFSQGTYKNISAPNGGVCYVELTGANYVQATHAATTAFTETFTLCTAVGDGTLEAPTGKGGVFYIKGKSSAKVPLKFNSTDKNHARFENNKAQHGNDIYIEDTLYTDSQIAELTGFGGNSLSAYYRVVTGTDSADCKWTSSYCKTLGWGITLLHFRFKNQTHMPQTIQYLYNATFTEKAIVVEDQTVTVRGSTAAKLNESTLSRTKITIDSKITEGSSLIEVGLNGSVHFTNLDLVPNTKASLLHVSSVSRGASMENVGIMLTSGQTYQYSLIKTENQPITIENTLINTTAATLAILLEPFLTVVTNADTPVAMKNVTFENLNMKTDPILQIQSAGSITLDEVKFKTAHERPAKMGYITQAQKDFFGTDEFLGEEHEWYDASLMYYLVPPTLKIKLDKNGREASTHPNCGSDRFVCSTLDSGYRSAEANEMDQVELFSDTSLAKTMTVAFPIQMRSSSESAIRTVTQEGQSGIVVIETGSLYLFKTTFGTATQQTLSSSLHTLARVKAGSTLTLEDTTFQNLAFSHESLGSAIFVENGGTLSADRGALFRTTLPLKTGTIFTRAQRNMFFGEMEGVAGSLLYYWYPHTALEDTLSVTTEGDDHVVCGIPELPCASFDHGFRSLKKSGTKIIVRTSSSVESALTTDFKTVVIEGNTSTRILTFTTAGSMRVKEGQTYTLQSLCLEIEDGTRTEAVLAVTGTVVTNGISFGKTTPVTINTPLVEVTSGNLGLTQVDFTWAGPAPRILSQSAGSSVVSGCTFTIGGEGSTLASSNLLEVSGGTLQLSDLTLDCTQKQISSLVALNGGQATLSKLLISNSVLTFSLVAGSGSLSITESTFSSQVDSSFSSNSASSTISFTVPSGKSLTVGDGVNPFSFLNCKSSSDGGAIVLEVENEGSATLKLVTFTSCESGGSGGGMKATVRTGGELTITQTSFTGCSSTAEGGALNVIVVGTGKVSIDGTFKKCESKSNGGALLLDASSIGSSGSFLLDSIVYGTGPSEMNQAGTGFKGHNLFIKTPAHNHASINTTSLTGSYLTLPANTNIFTDFETEQYTFCETNGVPTSILHLFNAYEGGKLIVDESNGMDHELCGHPRLPCSSLSQSLGNLKGQNMVASLDTDIPLSTIASSSKLSTIEPRSNGRTTITISENVTITIVSSTLTLSSLDFAVNAALFSQSAVSITGGSLNVDDCVDAGAIVFEVESEGSASLNLVTFTSCESGGAGGGMKATVKTGGELSITQTSFTGCSSTAEGGALLIDASSIGSTGSFLLDSIVYGTGPSEMNQAGTGFKGHNLFIKTPAHNHASINTTSLTGSYLTLPANTNIFTDFETEQYTFCETNGVPTSILYLFNAYEGGKLIVDESNGMDHELCGHPRLPCSSLSQSLGNLKCQDMLASLDTDIALSTIASSTKLSTIGHHSNNRKIVTISENVTITIVSSTLTLSSLDFAVNAALFSQSAVSITGGSLNVDDCVDLWNDPKWTITDRDELSSFLTCVSDSDAGAIVFEVESEGSASLNLVTFTSCESGGAGGGMKATVKTGGELSITQTSFTGCSSTAEGGALLIDASSGF
ncbi:hypothetical protein BLNAU_14850 [Blattamonas nauphoetae]|uniref:Uncharacterized protein n=1 Tax=Blattamonas nauphoetae TaxID=2049346 RepID=A0ABQ9XEP3_9EUKA|nr:hypothetical protein BLNAU_14850 [Blattamonas nauphoetae]